MKKLQILVTIAFIISIMSFGVFAMPEADAGPNSNIEKSNIENNNTEKGNVENNNTEKSNIENNNTKKGNVENNNTGKSNVENNNTGKSNVENNNTEKGNVENNNTGKSNVENNNKEKSNTENKGGILKKGKCGKCNKDPLKRLEERKESIQKDLKEGKITKEKAEELTKKIDERIVKVKEFNSLTLPQKKEHLSKNFSSHLEKQIKDGRITKEEGEKIQADFNKQLESWDGKEPPKFMHKIKKHKD